MVRQFIVSGFIIMLIKLSQCVFMHKYIHTYIYYLYSIEKNINQIYSDIIFTQFILLQNRRKIYRKMQKKAYYAYMHNI